MKKILLYLITVVLSILMIVTFSLIGCKAESSEQATTEAATTEAATTEAATTEAAETTVAEEPVHIRLVGWNEESTFGDILNYIEESAKEQNIEFEYQFVDNQQLDNVLNTQFAAGEGPDMIEIGSAFLGQVNAGYLLDITGNPNIDKYLESPIQNFTIEGKVYGLPAITFFGGIYYNKDIFEEHNLTVPKTWDEFLAIGDKLAGTDIKPFIVPGKDFGLNVWPMFGVLNVSFYDDPDNWSFDEKFAKGSVKASDYWLDGLEKYWDPMLQEGYITGEMTGLDNNQCMDEFALGKVAMFPGVADHLPLILEKNPDLNLGMFPYPAVEKGKEGWLCGSASVGWGINADSKNIDASLKILDIVSTTECQIKLQEFSNGPSPFKGLEYELDSHFEDAMTAIKEGHLYAAWAKWMYAQQLIETLSKEAQIYYAGDKEVSDFLKAFDDKNAELLEAYTE